MLGGERRNFAQLLMKCIVVGNPLEIEMGSAHTHTHTRGSDTQRSIAEPEKLGAEREEGEEATSAETAEECTREL